MEKTKVHLDNGTKNISGQSNSKFPNDGTSIAVTGKSKVLVYRVATNGLLELVFNDSVETAEINSENNSIDIPENCHSISFQLSDQEFSTASFVFEVI